MSFNCPESYKAFRPYIFSNYHVDKFVRHYDYLAHRLSINFDADFGIIQGDFSPGLSPTLWAQQLC